MTREVTERRAHLARREGTRTFFSLSPFCSPHNRPEKEKMCIKYFSFPASCCCLPSSTLCSRRVRARVCVFASAGGEEAPLETRGGARVPRWGPVLCGGFAQKRFLLFSAPWEQTLADSFGGLSSRVADLAKTNENERNRSSPKFLLSPSVVCTTSRNSSVHETHTVSHPVFVTSLP